MAEIEFFMTYSFVSLYPCAFREIRARHDLESGGIALPLAVTAGGLAQGQWFYI